jgi:2,4-dienoyl-CoA reductase (NADPH2)
MGRKLLADPDLPAKLAMGRADRVRPCIYQYRCIGNIFLNEPVACVANPATAHGDRPLPPAARPRHVLVVGGGPAGLETARLLDGRGHTVVLAEAAPRLGGVLVVAGRADPVLAQLLTWQLAELDDSGVELRVATPVTAELVADLAVDEVVLATGGSWAGAQVPVAKDGRLRDVAELDGWLEADDGSIAREVVVLGGDKAGLSMAQVLAHRGHEVTVLEPGAVLGVALGPPGRFRVVHETEQLGVHLETGTTVIRVEADGVRWRDSAGDERHTPARTVLSTLVEAVRPALADELAALGLPVHVVGDARAAGGLEGALADAHAVAAALD